MSSLDKPGAFPVNLRFFRNPVMLKSHYPYELIAKEFSLIKTFLAAFSTFVLCLSQQVLSNEILPCSIMLKFGQDASGPVAEYRLSAQLTNRTGRSISGVSVLFFDSAEKLLGNTELDCTNNAEFLTPGSTGECSMLMQTIDGKMMEKFGTEMWTAIVNVQLQKLNSIAQCKTLGVRYGEESG